MSSDTLLRRSAAAAQPADAQDEKLSDWDAFSAAYERCLPGVYLFVHRRVNDPEWLRKTGQTGGPALVERIVTEVLANYVDVLVSPIPIEDRLRKLLAAANAVIAQRASAGPSRDGAAEPEATLPAERIEDDPESAS